MSREPADTITSKPDRLLQTPPDLRRRGAGSQQGIAIVSVLLVMVALTAFGLSTMFLTQMNLGIAGNARSATLADNNAAAGLNAAFVALQRAYEQNGEFPNSLTLPSIGGSDFSPTYALVSYQRRSATVAYVAVSGSAPGQAEYLSEALVSMTSSGERLPAYFDYGISTEGTFRGNGSASYVSAGIHANRGFTLNGSQQFLVCTARDANGICTATAVVSGDTVPISSSPGGTCSVNPGQLAICAGGVPAHLTDPVAITPDYQARRDAALAAVSRGAYYSNYFGINCDLRYTTRPNPVGQILTDIASLPAGSTVCLDYSQNTGLNGNATINNVNIVSRGDFTINGDLNSVNSTFIVYDGKFSTNGKGTMTNMNVYAQESITLNGSKDAVYTGTTTFATAGNITINGSYRATQIGGGQVTIGIAMIANGNITVNGSSEMFIAAVAGGTFTQNGSSTLRGRVASKGNITFNGSFDIDSGLGISNPELSEPGDADLAVLSRR